MWQVRDGAQQYFIPGVCNLDDGAGNAGGGAGGTGDGASGTGSQGAAETTFSQADVDRIVGQRLARAEKDLKAKFDEEAKKAGMSDLEKAKADAEEAKRQAGGAVEKAKGQYLAGAAQAALAAAGVKPERLGYAVKLLDLSGVTVSDEFEVDGKLLEASIAKLTKDFPEILGAAQGQNRQVGGDFSGGGGATGGADVNAMIRKAAGF